MKVRCGCLHLIIVTTVVVFAAVIHAQTFTADQLLANLRVPAGQVGPDGWHLSPHVESADAGIRLESGAVRMQQWTYASRLQSPHGLIPPGVFNEGGRLTVDLKLQVDAGRLYLRLHDGVRFYQVQFTPTQIAFSKIHPRQAVTVETAMTAQPHLVKIQFSGRRAAIIVDGRELTRMDHVGLGGESAFSGIQLLALDQQQLPDASVYELRVDASAPKSRTAASAHQPDDVAVTSAWPARTIEQDGDRVTVGPVRVLLRHARSPMLVTRDNRLMLTGDRTISSEDHGQTWRPHSTKFNQLNTIFLQDGRVLAMRYDPKPVPDSSGQYQTDRWFSSDGNQPFEPTEPATVHLPADRFDPEFLQWFHSGLVQLPGGDLLSVMQGQELVDALDAVTPWRLFLVRSNDLGKTWHYVSTLADYARMAPIRPQLQARGWRIYGGVEPTLLAIDEQNLICVARTVDDESYLDQRVIGQPQTTYHDLSYTVRGDEIYPDVARLPSDNYYEPGPLSAPLIIMRSSNGGKTWSMPRAMAGASGCFPRLACQDGVIALTFGGIAAPRWGNAVCFSFDHGTNWTQPVIFAPFLTTGYTAIASTGPGQFTAFFDSTPPQAWQNPSAFWIGAVDLAVEKNSSRETRP
ncbi:MAG: exo-alpha-sialidase [Phycisphaeraceae bacterium]|nr:exo-alpha-sialidase [Phycisphaeraceae bacterium]